MLYRCWSRRRLVAHKRSVAMDLIIDCMGVILRKSTFKIFVLSYLIGMFPGHLLSRPDSQADVLLGGAHLFAQHHFCQWRQDYAGTTFPRESLSQAQTHSSSCIMHICLRICNLPHFCGFRMKTWSWLKWSCWDSLWRGIWPWLSSKRARWKPEYQHFLLYIKFKHYTPCFNNKTEKSDMLWKNLFLFVQQPHHIIQMVQAWHEKSKCHFLVTGQTINTYVICTLHTHYQKTDIKTHTLTHHVKFTWFSFFYQFSLTFSRFSKLITLDSWTKYTDHQVKLNNIFTIF